MQGIEIDEREEVICALNYAWSDALEEYGIPFQRPTLLSEVSDACRFPFFKK
jgi:hypothetical protein